MPNDGISLTICRGEFVAIVGKSGSGKSTLLKLFMRFWDAGNGSVEISGRDISGINTADLRDMESFMTQETHLFHDSIRSNLRIAKLSATDAEIEAACRKASIHDFIMGLPQGYDTPVGELWGILFRAVRGSGWGWQGPSCMMRPSCSSTSRPATWTA